MFALKRLLAAAVTIALLAIVLPLVLPTVSVGLTVSVRGAYGQDSSASTVDIIKGVGFNTVTVMPSRAKLDALASLGMKGLVWLYGYDRTACEFVKSDAEIRTLVSAIAGHRAIAAYQIDDEPNARLCPTAPAQMKARTQLIHSIDPAKPTYIVVSTWNGYEAFPYQDFAGTADILGLDVYPCSTSYGCRFDNIDKAIAEADKDGVSTYWAILQDFQDSYYRLPTADEVKEQFSRWSTSRMQGYFVYHWNYGAIEKHLDHMRMLTEENALFTADTSTKVVVDGPSSSPSPTPTVSASPSSSPETSPVVSPSPSPTPLDSIPPSASPGVSARWDKAKAFISWIAATDNVGVVSYSLVRDGRVIKVTTSLSFYDRPKTGTTHRYEVYAVDAAGNVSSPALTQLAPPNCGKVRCR